MNPLLTQRLASRLQKRDKVLAHAIVGAPPFDNPLLPFSQQRANIAVLAVERVATNYTAVRRHPLVFHAAKPGNAAATTREHFCVLALLLATPSTPIARTLHIHRQIFPESR